MDTAPAYPVSQSGPSFIIPEAPTDDASPLYRFKQTFNDHAVKFHLLQDSYNNDTMGHVGSVPREKANLILDEHTENISSGLHIVEFHGATATYVSLIFVVVIAVACLICLVCCCYQCKTISRLTKMLSPLRRQSTTNLNHIEMQATSQLPSYSAVAQEEPKPSAPLALTHENDFLSVRMP